MKIEISKKDLKKIIVSLKSEAKLCNWCCLYDEEQEADKLMEKLQRALEKGK